MSGLPGHFGLIGARWRPRCQLAYQRSWDGLPRRCLGRARTDDLRRAVTTVGPQRDDMVVTLDGMPARTHASQGEQRSLALALRLVRPSSCLDQRRERTGAAARRRVLRVGRRALRSPAGSSLPAGQALLTTAGYVPPKPSRRWSFGSRTASCCHDVATGIGARSRGSSTGGDVSRWRGPSRDSAVPVRPSCSPCSRDGRTLVGPDVAAHARPLSLRDGVLVHRSRPARPGPLSCAISVLTSWLAASGGRCRGRVGSRSGCWVRPCPDRGRRSSGVPAVVEPLSGKMPHVAFSTAYRG